MHPVLLTIGRFHIYTYGVMVAIGVFLGGGLFIKELRRSGVSPQDASDVFFYIIVFGIAFSRLFYVVENPEPFIKSPLAVLKVWEGGFVFYGAIIGGVIGLIFICKKKKLDSMWVLDKASPFIPLAHAIGRIGCFSAGCCYGKACRLPWAIVVKDPKSLSPLGIPLHPVQLYSSAANLAIFLILFFHTRKKASFKGEVFLTYLALYGLARFFLEFFRGDPRPMVCANLSLNQVLSAFVFLLSLFILKKKKKL